MAAAGLGDRVEIRVQDYRDLRGERFDAISSVGMFEHVGKVRTAQYFETLHGLLAPGGRLLNHAISEQGGSKLRPWSFFGRYVFPDGELLDVGDVVLAMERAGFECRDVESLREHYARTLRSWVANLEANWEAAVAAGRAARARGSGVSTWPDLSSASRTVAFRCSRSSASCPTPDAAGCRPPDLPGAEQAPPRQAKRHPGLAMTGRRQCLRVRQRQQHLNSGHQSTTDRRPAGMGLLALALSLQAIVSWIYAVQI